MPKRKRRRFTPEFKARVALEVLKLFGNARHVHMMPRTPGSCFVQVSSQLCYSLRNALAGPVGHSLTFLPNFAVTHQASGIMYRRYIRERRQWQALFTRPLSSSNTGSATVQHTGFAKSRRRKTNWQYFSLDVLLYLQGSA